MTCKDCPAELFAIELWADLQNQAAEVLKQHAKAVSPIQDSRA